MKFRITKQNERIFDKMQNTDISLNSYISITNQALYELWICSISTRVRYMTHTETRATFEDQT